MELYIFLPLSLFLLGALAVFFKHIIYVKSLHSIQTDKAKYKLYIFICKHIIYLILSLISINFGSFPIYTALVFASSDLNVDSLTLNYAASFLSLITYVGAGYYLKNDSQLSGAKKQALGNFYNDIELGEIWFSILQALFFIMILFSIIVFIMVLSLYKLPALLLLSYF